MSRRGEPRVRPALTPLSWLYGAWMRHRNSRYDRPDGCTPVEAPVVSVGNLSAGGTGKTPIVRWLAESMLALGITPAIVSRGYRGSAGAGPLVVSQGDGVRCSADESGDEPWMLAHALPEAFVVVGSNRIAGAREAIRLGAQLILLDDGFQHRALARDLDVVLIDRTRPFDRDRLLPAGRLREPPSSLGRADWILITRSPSALEDTSLRESIESFSPGAQVLHADHRARGFLDASGRPAPRPRRVVAFCGIGHPNRFRRDLERLDIEIVVFRAFADHQSIDASELESLRQQADEGDAVLVTTEKDLARIGPEASSAVGLFVLAIEPTIEGGERLIEAVADLVPRRSS